MEKNFCQFKNAILDPDDILFVTTGCAPNKSAIVFVNGTTVEVDIHIDQVKFIIDEHYEELRSGR